MGAELHRVSAPPKECFVVHNPYNNLHMSLCADTLHYCIKILHYSITFIKCFIKFH